MNRRVVIGSFRAVSDGGTQYEIVIFQEFIPTSSHDDPQGEVPGLKSLLTDTGLVVNYIDPETFKIVATNEIVRKVS